MKVTDEEKLELRHPNPTNILDGFNVVVREVNSMKVSEGDILKMADECRLIVISYIAFIFTNLQNFDSPLFDEGAFLTH